MIPPRFQTVLDELAPLTARFRDAGHRLYLVGGSVRDLLAGADIAEVDFDFTTVICTVPIDACTVMSAFCRQLVPSGHSSAVQFFVNTMHVPSVPPAAT